MRLVALAMPLVLMSCVVVVEDDSARPRRERTTMVEPTPPPPKPPPPPPAAVTINVVWDDCRTLILRDYFGLDWDATGACEYYIRHHRYDEDEILVLAFIAAWAKIEFHEAAYAYEKCGFSLFLTARTFRMTGEEFFVDIPASLACPGPYGRAYGWHRQRAGMLRLTNAECRALVTLGVAVRFYGFTAQQWFERVARAGGSPRPARELLANDAARCGTGNSDHRGQRRAITVLPWKSRNEYDVFVRLREERYRSAQSIREARERLGHVFARQPAPVLIEIDRKEEERCRREDEEQKQNVEAARRRAEEQQREIDKLAREVERLRKEQERDRQREQEERRRNEEEAARAAERLRREREVRKDKEREEDERRKREEAAAREAERARREAEEAAKKNEQERRKAEEERKRAEEERMKSEEKKDRETEKEKEKDERRKREEAAAREAEQARREAEEAAKKNEQERRKAEEERKRAEEERKRSEEKKNKDTDKEKDKGKEEDKDKEAEKDGGAKEPKKEEAAPPVPADQETARKVAAARKFIGDLGAALDSYFKEKKGYPPTGADELAKALQMKNRKGQPYFVFADGTQDKEGRVVDPWGHAMHYRNNRIDWPKNKNDKTAHNKQEFDLAAAGPDGKFEDGRGDDIANWAPEKEKKDRK